MLAAAALGTVAAFPSFGQTNLGAACGCPAVGSRTTVNMSTLPGYNATTGELDQGAVLSCNNTYILDQRIHVPNGQVIKIAPGTVIKGKPGTGPATETALIIERGGMIDACGTVDCPIVFTAEADPLDGTYSLDNKGKWGGIVILGRAQNNLTVAKNGTYPTSGRLAIKDGVGVIEGFNNPSPKYWFGADINGTPAEAFNNADNSGTLKYVSIRFSGAVLEVGNEINGLTLGSVGNRTTIDHVEIVSPADDAIEFFGGTVNVKYISVLYGNDDMFDWDLGYNGKAQFLFGVKAPNAFNSDSDNGFEADADDNKSDNTLRSHPIIFNATFIGNDKSTLLTPPLGDNSALAAINAKEYTEGEISNSLFANFRRGFNLAKAPGTRPSGQEAYNNWIAGSLKVKCNTFLQPTTPTLTEDFTIDLTLVPAGTDRDQFITADKNVVSTTTLAGFDPAVAITLPANVTNAPDVVPTLLNTTGCAVAPVDGFFSPAAYRGAFAPTGKNWLSDWTYGVVIKAEEGVQPCPTDLTGDGSTTNADLAKLLLEFGKACK